MVEENKSKKRPDIIIPRETKFDKYVTPSCLETWSENGATYSQEYQDQLEDMSAICDHLCKMLNEGSETKDSFTKRALTLRAIIRFLFQRTFLNNFVRLGVLEQIRFDILYTQEMQIALKNYEKAMKSQSDEQQKRERNYVQ